MPDACYRYAFKTETNALGDAALRVICLAIFDIDVLLRRTQPASQPWPKVPHC